jgi:D-amino-acid dehydrogenase
MTNSNTIAVIGAGIVGLSTAFFLLDRGHAITLIDPDPSGDKASFGNAASFATSECVPAGLPGLWKKIPGWLVDPQGPLFLKPSHVPELLPWLWAFNQSCRPARVSTISQGPSQLNANALSAASTIVDAIGYGNHVHHNGALMLYRNRKSFEADRLSWAIREQFAISYDTVEGERLWALEPALSQFNSFGVVTDHWSHVDDPRDLHQRLYRHLVERNVSCVEAKVVGMELGSNASITCHTNPGQALDFSNIVVTAGAFSTDLAKQIGDRVLLTSERGYNATLPNPGFRIQRPLVFAEQKTVATPVAGGLRIGGAAEFAGLKAPANYKRSEALVQAVKPIFKTLDTGGMTKWMGHRPATPDSLPVIGRSPRHPSVYYAFGHGHLGLTQGPITGQLIADLISGRRTAVDLSPYGIQRFG